MTKTKITPATAADPTVAAANVETAISFILTGFQLLAENEVELPVTEVVVVEVDDLDED